MNGAGQGNRRRNVMKCPRTGSAMLEVEINGVKVDVSEGCGGVWFDALELSNFDQAHESQGEKLLELVEKYQRNDIDLSERINSPKHLEVVMMRHFYSPKRKIEIDECPQCGGIWLDAGELAKIRELFSSDLDRKAAVQSMVSEIFDDPELQNMKKEGEGALTRARRFSNMFRWICPSAYISGDQDWGAF